MKTCSTDSLTASFANKMSDYCVNSVNKNFLSLAPLRPMPIMESTSSFKRLCVLVRVLPTCIEPGDCEFRTCCDGTRGNGIATELRMILLLVKENQLFINGDWVRPGLHDILDVQPRNSAVLVKMAKTGCVSRYFQAEIVVFKSGIARLL